MPHDVLISNSVIEDSLEMLGKLMELHGEDSFKAKALQSAGFNLSKVQGTIATMSDADLLRVPGVGKAVLEKIQQLVQTGRLRQLEELLTRTPPGVLDLLRVKGLGPKKVGLIWKELGVESIGELEYACRENRLALLRGFGAKTQESVLRTLEYIKTTQDKHLYAEVEDIAMVWQRLLNEAAAPHPVLMTGDVKRLNLVVGIVDFALSENAWPGVEALLHDKGITTTSIENGLVQFEEMGVDIRLHVCKDNQVQWCAFRNAMSDEHAKQLIENGLVDKPAAIKSEEAIYKSLKLPYIVPEMREGLNEWHWSKKHSPDDLVTDADFKGMIHLHTQWSDGLNTTEEMARRCIELGMEYMVLSDHSQAAYYAQGLKPDAILKQHAEVDKLNKTLAPFRIFKSIECDILGEGQLDYNDEILSLFDLVIVSIHSQFKMSEEKATQRLIRAVENPHTFMLCHPTGRLLLARPGYPINHMKVIDACAANNVALEINANPKRLDVDWTWVWYAMEKGVMISVNPDAHSIGGLSDTRYGMLAARKGGLVKEHLLNARSLKDFNALVDAYRKKR